MNCWYCYWGWAKQVAAIYTKWLAVAGESAMHFGPAHIVWEDENFERHHVQWSLDHADEYRAQDCTDEEHEAVKQSLIELLALPDHILTPEPADYDGQRPELFPPAVEMEQL